MQVLRPLALVLAGEGRVVEPRLERGPLLLERRLPRLHAGLVLREPALRRGRAPPGLLLRLVRRHVLLLEALHRRQHEHAADLPLPALPVAVAVDQRLHVRDLLVDLRLRLRVGLLRVREERPERVRRDVRGPVGPPPRGERGVVLALDDLPERELGLRLVQLVLRGLATALGVAQRPRRPLELLPRAFHLAEAPALAPEAPLGVRGGRCVRAVGPPEQPVGPARRHGPRLVQEHGLEHAPPQLRQGGQGLAQRVAQVVERRAGHRDDVARRRRAALVARRLGQRVLRRRRRKPRQEFRRQRHGPLLVGARVEGLEPPVEEEPRGPVGRPDRLPRAQVRLQRRGRRVVRLPRGVPLRAQAGGLLVDGESGRQAVGARAQRDRRRRAPGLGVGRRRQQVAAQFQRGPVPRLRALEGRQLGADAPRRERGRRRGPRDPRTLARLAAIGPLEGVREGPDQVLLRRQGARRPRRVRGLPPGPPALAHERDRAPGRRRARVRPERAPRGAGLEVGQGRGRALELRRGRRRRQADAAPRDDAGRLRRRRVGEALQAEARRRRPRLCRLRRLGVDVARPGRQLGQRRRRLQRCSLDGADAGLPPLAGRGAPQGERVLHRVSVDGDLAGRASSLSRRCLFVPI